MSYIWNFTITVSPFKKAIVFAIPSTGWIKLTIKLCISYQILAGR